MKKTIHFLFLLGFTIAFLLGPASVRSVQAAHTDLVPLYRLYYRPTHEHLFTTDSYEKTVLSTQGAWVYEGIAWYAPSSGAPVYRLFNPSSRDHLYTRDRNEYNTLGSQGWQQEGVAWYSSDKADANAIPVYRLFAPSLSIGSHFYTLDRNERSALLASGAWNDEAIAWYAAARGEAAPAQPAVTLSFPAIDLTKGTFDMKASNVTAPGGAQAVTFGVWSAADFSNYYEYAGQKQADGTWTARANYASHQALKGKYTVLVKVTGGDGVTENEALGAVDNPFRNMEYNQQLAGARRYIDSVTTPGMTTDEKLRAVFDSYENLSTANPWIPHYGEADWAIRYADSFFELGYGNCFSYAASFAYCARALGYDNIYVCRSATHGWCEINGKIYDPMLAFHMYDRNFYAIDYAAINYPDYTGAIVNGDANARLPLP